MTERSVRVVLFDVNETLSDMSPLRCRFEQVGAPPELARLWFTSVLRDGIALTTVGEFASFRDVAEGVLRELFAGLNVAAGKPTQAAKHVLDGFAEFDVHPDVPDGVRRLQAAGFRLATLTNGDAKLTEQLLERAGIRDTFEALLDLTPVRAWKPAAAAYRYALGQLHAQPNETMLVAVHPWDITGARHAGLQAAWLQRDSRTYPTVMTRPTITAADVRDLARLLTAS